MPEGVDINDIAVCSACGKPMRIASLAPFTNVACPSCGVHNRVKCEFGPYRLVKRHAIGGMSLVFLAHDRTLDREVAVKVLNEDYSADARRIAAFEEEARVTASFSHPHVVRVFTTGRAFGRFYIAMELVVGGHLEERIKKQRAIPEAEMLPLAIQVVEGLKAAHRAGLIHRDIKPGNILLDGQGNAKIVDFGLALLLDPGGKAKAQEIWATPYYVPPETIEGHPEDFRSDMYAFGATLYHALAGRPPCNEESMATTVLREAKRKVVPLHKVAPSLSERTCALVDRAMAYQPAQRFGSYDELLSYLHDALKHVRKGRGRSLGKADGRGAAVVGKADARGAAAGRVGNAAGVERLMVGLGMAAVAAACLVAVWWVTRRPAVEVPSGVVGAGVGGAVVADGAGLAMRAAELREEALAAMKAGDYGKAQVKFGVMRDDVSVGEPQRSLAAAEAVLMAFIGMPESGSDEPVKAEAGLAMRHVGRAALDSGMKGWLPAVLGRLAGGSGSAAAAVVKEPTGGGEQILCCMLLGAAAWNAGALEEAGRQFGRAASAVPGKDGGWAAGYAEMAQEYLADRKWLSDPVFSVVPADAEACRRAIAGVEEIGRKLKTRGRAQFQVASWKAQLEGELRKLDEGKGGGKVLAGGLREVVAELEKFAGQCRFAEAAAYIEGLGGAVSAETRSGLLALTRQAQAFLEGMEKDLQGTELNQPGRLKDRQVFVKVTGAGGGGLRLETLDGVGREVAWALIDPGHVLEIHARAVRDRVGGAGTPERKLGAVAFMWLALDRAAAVEWGDELAASDAAMKVLWEKVKAALP